MHQQDHSSDEVDWDELQSRLPTLEAAANALLGYLGRQFSETDAGHLETDIAAAASVAGSSLLRRAVPNLSDFTPGTAILSDVHREQDHLFKFMAAVATSLGLSEKAPRNYGDDTRHRPLLPLIDLVARLQDPLRKVTANAGLPPELLGYVGALAAMKLVAAGKSMKMLDERVGKSIALYYVVAGSKTVPPAFAAADQA